MVIYHNKWLSTEEMYNQNLLYSCGEMACYGYFMFQGLKFAKPVVQGNLKDSYYKIRQIIKKVLFLKWERVLVLDIKSVLLEIIFRIRGLLVGLIYSVFDPIIKQVN